MLPVQPVIRDIRTEHLYFDADGVCAIIDFGAMQIDTVACDLARLLGTSVGVDKAAIANGLELYHSKRRLLTAERQIVPHLIVAGLVIGLQNWLRWIFVDGRTFDSPEAAVTRIRTLMKQLQNSPY